MIKANSCINVFKYLLIALTVYIEDYMKEPKDYIIFPLDVPTFDEAKRLISLLANDIGIFKVGLELFISAGPEIIKYIHNAGTAKVFLDLKLHDIPATVERAAAIVGELGVKFATVHCGDSVTMLEGAVRGSGGKTGILGVTVLTSTGCDDLLNAGYKEEYCNDLSNLVTKKAMTAKKAGCAGVICSGLEVKKIKEICGADFFAITPGIRPDWEELKTDDQKRITTPADAVKNGSDYIVIGRPIRDAKSPVEAARKVASEIASVIH